MSTMEIDASRASEEVLGLLDKQVTLYGELETLADKQSQLLGEDDATPLLKVLACRQRLTVALQDLAQRMAPFRAEWQRVKEAMNARQRESAESMVLQVNERLRRLIERDERDVRMLAARRRTVGAALDQLKCGQSTVQAYGQPVAAGHSNFDQTHDGT